MIKTSKNYYLYRISSFISTFLILTSTTAIYSSAIASDKLSILNSHTNPRQQPKAQKIGATLTKQIPDSPEITNSADIEKIQQVSKQQNATIVQYSIITDESIVQGKIETQESELYIWVIKPTGEMQFRKVDLKAWGKVENNSFLNLFGKNRRRHAARSVEAKGIVTYDKPKNKSWKFDLPKLHQVLIEPIADLLPQKPEERVVFIPQGELFTVPFAALQDAKGKYLIEKHTISTAPSIQVLDLLYQRQKGRKDAKPFVPKHITGDELLIVGNPTAPKTPLNPARDNCKPARLPGAEEEAKNIAEMFQTQPLIGDAATETAIVEKMPQARIIPLLSL